MDGVAVDLSNVKIVLNLVHLVGLDAVSNTPDAIRSILMVISQGLPEGALQQRDDTSRLLWCSSVVLAGKGQRWLVSGERLV